MHALQARRAWILLWSAVVGLLMLLLFATLSDRPLDPEALRYFPAEMLERGRQFAREVRVVATFKTLVSLGTLLWLCFSDAGARLLTWLEAAGGGRGWRSLAAVAAGIIGLTALVELPFAYYLGHAHEQAYGLANASAGEWLADYVLGLALDLVVGLALWLPLYLLIRRFPRNWWAPGALVYVGFTGLLTLLSPVLFLPLFNTLQPVQDPEVQVMVERLADRAGVEVGTVRILHASEKTNRVNAMVTGLGPTKQVILYDTLLQQFEPPEVEVVVAHEMAHAIHRDVVTGWLLSGALTALTLLVAARMLGGMIGVGPLQLAAPHAARGLALLMLILLMTGHLAAPLENLVSRRMEVRADRFALDLTRNPGAFVSGFTRLAAGNPGDVDPPPVVEWLSHSHPSILHRIRAASMWSGR